MLGGSPSFALAGTVSPRPLNANSHNNARSRSPVGSPRSPRSPTAHGRRPPSPPQLDPLDWSTRVLRNRVVHLASPPPPPPPPQSSFGRTQASTTPSRLRTQDHHHHQYGSTPSDDLSSSDHRNHDEDGDHADEDSDDDDDGQIILSPRRLHLNQLQKQQQSKPSSFAAGSSVPVFRRRPWPDPFPQQQQQQPTAAGDSSSDDDQDDPLHRSAKPVATDAPPTPSPAARISASTSATTTASGVTASTAPTMILPPRSATFPTYHSSCPSPPLLPIKKHKINKAKHPASSTSSSTWKVWDSTWWSSPWSFGRSRSLLAALAASALAVALLVALARSSPSALSPDTPVEGVVSQSPAADPSADPITAPPIISSFPNSNNNDTPSKTDDNDDVLSLLRSELAAVRDALATKLSQGAAATDHRIAAMHAAMHADLKAHVRRALATTDQTELSDHVKTALNRIAAAAAAAAVQPVADRVAAETAVVEELRAAVAEIRAREEAAKAAAKTAAEAENAKMKKGSLGANSALTSAGAVVVRRWTSPAYMPKPAFAPMVAVPVPPLNEQQQDQIGWLAGLASSWATTPGTGAADTPPPLPIAGGNNNGMPYVPRPPEIPFLPFPLAAAAVLDAASASASSPSAHAVPATSLSAVAESLVGRCWAAAVGNAVVTIKLPPPPSPPPVDGGQGKRRSIARFAVAHLHPSATVDFTSAPRVVAVWGIYSSTSGTGAGSTAPASSFKDIPVVDPTSVMAMVTDQDPTTGGPVVRVHLADLTLDRISSTNGGGGVLVWASAPVRHEARALVSSPKGAPSVVAFEVQSNHGHREYTCVYRLAAYEEADPSDGVQGSAVVEV